MTTKVVSNCLIVMYDIFLKNYVIRHKKYIKNVQILNFK